MFFLAIILVVLAVIGAAVALVRGLVAFASDGDLLRKGLDPNFMRRGEQQNRMMMQRVIFQAIAVVLVALLGMLVAKS